MHLKSKNRKCEQEMVDSVKQHYSNLFVQEQSSSSVSGQSKYCDITLEYNSIFYHLEAKHNNNNDNPNYCKQMLAECLYNRNKHKKNVKSSEHQFGLLLDCNTDKTSILLQRIKKHYSADDWTKFGKCFKCTAVFLYDKESKKLYFLKWAEVFMDDAQMVLISNE